MSTQSRFESSTTIVACSAKQRHHIRWHMQQLGLKTARVTEQLTPYLDNARLSLPLGADLEQSLRAISFTAAARLICALRTTN